MAVAAARLDRTVCDVWLTDLGTHRLRDLPRPERVVQLCHPDLRNEFPPLRTATTIAADWSMAPHSESHMRVDVRVRRRVILDRSGV